MIDPRPWIGFDFDGTLVEHGHIESPEDIGPPIPSMVERIKHCIKVGWKVKIFTARVGAGEESDFAPRARVAIEQWCVEHLGQVLEVTAEKDQWMLRFYDDRAIQVERDTGVILGRE